MMKKIIKQTIVFAVLLLIPFSLSGATLKDYQDKLAAYKNELAKNKQEINAIEGRIRNNSAQIEQIKKDFIISGQEVQRMQDEYDQHNADIKQKGIESKQLIEYLQMANGENIYLEYAFGADSVTEFIYRMSLVEQLIDHNERTIKDLERMIEENKQKEKELTLKIENLKVEQANLSKSIENLTGVKSSINDNAISVAQQVKIYEADVASLIKQGCKPQHVIGVHCATSSIVAGFYRPTTSGYVTSEVGPRWGSFHRGIDVSNKNPYSTTIYPVANGTIKSIYKDTYGALIVIMHHKTANGKYYSSLYAHMSKYAPGLYVGKNMRHTDPIGTMGNTGYSTGPHLHLEVVNCRIYDLTDKNCSTWSKYAAFVQRQFNNGSFKGPRSVISFPNPGVTYTKR